MDSSNGSKNMSSKLQIVFVVLVTNLLTVLFLAGPLGVSNLGITQSLQERGPVVRILSPEDNGIAQELKGACEEIKALEDELKASRKESKELRSHINALTEFLKNTFQEQQNNTQEHTSVQDEGFGSLGIEEFGRWVEGKKLPLGYNPTFGTDTIFPSVGRACGMFKEDIKKYMSYTPGEICPDDELLEQKLILRGCEPLPRRRCFPRIPNEYVEPYPFPQSMWKIPPDSSVNWNAYKCKNFTCLELRKYSKGFDDCKDCFDLKGRESTRWMVSSSTIDLSIDEVLELKNGTIRIGLDIGGGTATFAVRMRERNVTVVTTSMNFNAPFNNFIASRGIVPMYLSISQRLPFFDNTLDLVHSMHVLSNWIPNQLLEFVLYDIYRILRPGGVFWLDHFFCIEDQLQVYVPMIESMGYNKLKWAISHKIDRGPEFHEIYITAVLEKPTKMS